MKLVVVLLFLFLLSCTSVPVKSELDLGQGVVMHLPKPQDLMASVRAVQTLTMRRQGLSRTFEAILENRQGRLTLAILAPFWPTPLKASYDGKEIQVDRALRANVPFDFQYVLGDIVLVYATAMSLKDWMSPGTQIVESKNIRTVSGVKASTPMIRITYESMKDPWRGTVYLNNKLRDYEIEITTVKVDFL